MKSQAYHARKKAKRKAKKQHILRTDGSVNPRKHLSPPKASPKTVLWEIQTHQDELKRLAERKKLQEAILRTVPSAVVKPEGNAQAARTHRLFQLRDTFQRLKGEAIRRKNRRYMLLMNDLRKSLAHKKTTSFLPNPRQHEP